MAVTVTLKVSMSGEKSWGVGDPFPCATYTEARRLVDAGMADQHPDYPLFGGNGDPIADNATVGAAAGTPVKERAVRRTPRKEVRG